MIDVFTALSFVLCAGKVSGTMSIAWVWVLLPLYARASFGFACWLGYLFRDI